MCWSCASPHGRRLVGETTLIWSMSASPQAARRDSPHPPSPRPSTRACLREAAANTAAEAEGWRRPLAKALLGGVVDGRVQLPSNARRSRCARRDSALLLGPYPACAERRTQDGSSTRLPRGMATPQRGSGSGARGTSGRTSSDLAAVISPVRGSAASCAPETFVLTGRSAVTASG